MERDKARSHAEILDELVPPLEKVRHEMKGLMLESQKAMLEAGLPKKLKRDEDIPHYYGCDSWRKQAEVPWNEAEKRALTPAEGIQILVAERDEAKQKATEATKKLREIGGGERERPSKRQRERKEISLDHHRRAKPISLIFGVFQVRLCCVLCVCIKKRAGISIQHRH